MQLEDEQIAVAMARAGIPQRLITAKHSLTNYGEIGKQLLEWLDNGVRDMFFVTSDPAATYAFYALARAALLTGVSTRIVGLPDLVESLSNPEFREELSRISALFVVGFYKDGFLKARDPVPPFDAETGDRIEWFFTKRLQGNNRTLFQANRVPGECRWWSPQFLKLVASSLDDGPMIVQSVAK